MSSFTKFDSTLKMSYNDAYSKEQKKDYWTVLESFTYYTTELDTFKTKKYFITVPKDFNSDGASVPRILWSLLPPWSDYGQAVVLHDYLREGGVAYAEEDQETKSNPIKPSILKQDMILLEAMGVLGVPAYKKYPLFLGVRFFALIKPFLK